MAVIQKDDFSQYINLNFLCVYFKFYLFFICMQSQIIDFNWETVKEWEVDDEGMSFSFKYAPPDKKPRYVKIFTPYVSFLCYKI